MNAANKITLFRLLLLPLMWVSALLDHIYLLIILIIFNAIGDIADGYVARKFKQETALGAKFDGYVDMAIYFSIFIWSIFFFPKIFMDHLTLTLILVGIGIAPLTISLIKFKRITAFHLLSSKVLAALIVGVFILALLLSQAIKPILIILIIAIIYNSLERCLILIINKKKTEKLSSIWDIIKKIKWSLY